MDMSDKIAVVFVNDSGFDTQKPELFTGNDMTYYGRWTYKYEETTRRGCLGIMIIHEDKAAGYPWEVVRNGWTGNEMVIVDENDNMGNAAVEGWFNKEKATQVFAAAGYTFEEMKQKALSDGFKPMQVMADFSTSVDSPSWFQDLPQTRLGIRCTYRTLDRYSPRFAPTSIVNDLGELENNPDAAFPDGSDGKLEHIYILISLIKIG